MSLILWRGSRKNTWMTSRRCRGGRVGWVKTTVVSATATACRRSMGPAGGGKTGGMMAGGRDACAPGRLDAGVGASAGGLALVRALGHGRAPARGRAPQTSACARWFSSWRACCSVCSSGKLVSSGSSTNTLGLGAGHFDHSDPRAGWHHGFGHWGRWRGRPGARPAHPRGLGCRGRRRGSSRDRQFKSRAV